MSDLVDKLKERLILSELVKAWVSSSPKDTERGNGGTRCCPFHSEKTPSFDFDDERGTFKCFGCGKQGDILTFIALMKNLDIERDFPRVLEVACTEAGIDYEQERGASQQLSKNRRIGDILTRFLEVGKSLWTAEKYVQAMQIGKTKKKTYLSKEIIERWNLAVAPKDSQALQVLSADELLSVGLLRQSERDGSTYMHFRKSLLIPHMRGGRAIYLADRAFGEDREKKILNMRKPHPRTGLGGVAMPAHFNIEALWDARAREKGVLCVEARLDAIACESRGHPATAFLSDVTPAFARDVRGAKVPIYYAPDGTKDVTAFKRAKSGARLGWNCKSCRLPAGADPDDLSGAQLDDIKAAAVDVVEEFFLASSEAQAHERDEVLRAFALAIREWNEEMPARVGEIRARVCEGLRLKESEYEEWIESHKQQRAVRGRGVAGSDRAGGVEGAAPAALGTPEDAVLDGVGEQGDSGVEGDQEDKAAITREDAEAWIAAEFDNRFELVKKEDGLARDKMMGLLFRDMAKYLFAASAITADRIRSQVCKDETKGGIGLGRRAYDTELRKARAEQSVEHGDQADYLRFARLFLNELSPGRAVLRWREEWLVWEAARGSYVILKKESMDALAVNWLSEKGVPIEERPVRDFLFAVRALVVLDDEIEPPCWINSRSPSVEFEYTDRRRKDGVYAVVKNGIVDIDSVKFLQGDERVAAPLIEHTPDFFTLTALPYKFDLEVEYPPPKLVAALEKWQPPMVRDEGGLRIRALQDFAGYIFWPGQDLKTFLLCIGPGDDGKSQIMKIYRALAGKPNCASVDLSSFDPKESFGRAPLLGKTFATVPDASKVERLAVGILKAITGGDSIGVNRKQKSVLDTPIGAKIMVTANTIPGFNDDSDAIWNRLLILYFDSIPKSEQEIGFAERLIDEEMPGIFLWALEGYHRLRTTRSFKKAGILYANVAKAKDHIQHERLYFEESIEPCFDGAAVGCMCQICANQQPAWVGVKNRGVIYTHKLVEQYKVFCEKNRYTLYCFGNTLGQSLRKWLRERLLLAGHTEAAVEIFLTEKRFIDRDKKAGKKRLEYYCGVEMLEWDNPSEDNDSS